MIDFPLRATGLTHGYGDRTVLSDVDFAIAAGESVAVMGASGSGKTTLLHCLAGILVPERGRVTCSGSEGAADLTALGEAARTRVRRRAFGFVFQDGMLLPELTAVENAALPLLLNGTDRSAAESHAAAWLTALGLAGLESRRLGELSGGQRQRVAIARAQVTGAAVVFADEPTGALDSRTSGEVMSALLDTARVQERSVVVVTHDADVARRCGRIVHLRDGRVVDETRARAGEAWA